MRSARLRGLTLTLVLLVATAVAYTRVAAQQSTTGHDPSQMHLYPLAELKWGSGPASLPPGAQFVVLEGDPAREGLFTMRLRLPDGYRIPSHYHSGVEHVTVISGTFNVGIGDKFDRAATRPMPAGTFGYWPPPMRHFAWAQGETILQLHGVGPWTVTYVNAADDPRKK
jgi:quercetin dioxygenase-like cupin family protein